MAWPIKQGGLPAAALSITALKNGAFRAISNRFGRLAGLSVIAGAVSAEVDTAPAVLAHRIASDWHLHSIH
jgi:hypothetical protein